jgi:alkyl sulfatase BDS1-like metallo-beta-lactamase superfamily hydrolase
MNQGARLDEIVHTVKAPQHLLDRPYLRPVYDEPEFVVRNVWRRYGGWWDGEFDNLLPAPRARQAAEWVALAGGVGPVLVRARELAESGEADGLSLACHLVEGAVAAEPASSEAHAVRAEVYAARSARQESSMARNILGHAGLASRKGRRDLAGDG